VKYKTQSALLTRMRETDKPVYLSFDDAFELAREFARKL
jgi:methylene-tetrahydromethanopterin dehydrogenase